MESKRGGKRLNAGRKSEVIGEVLQRKVITVDTMTLRKLKVIGNGNISKAVRMATAIAYARYQRDT